MNLYEFPTLDLLRYCLRLSSLDKEWATDKLQEILEELIAREQQK